MCLTQQCVKQLSILIDQKALPYLTLGTTPGVTPTYFPSVVDYSSDAIYIPRGFPIGRSNQTTVYVIAFIFTIKLIVFNHLYIRV